MKTGLAVILPGIGYHKDNPLLYYASKLVKSKGYELVCTMYSYPDCNHSLESGDIKKDIEILADVMEKTRKYLDSKH